MKNAIAIVLSALVFAGCADPHKRLASNVAYGDDPEQQLDVYEPRDAFDSSGPRPVIIAVHGGAWQSGDKSWGEQVAEEFASEGYVVASVNYRLAPDHRWPAQIEDCQAAMDYVRSKAVEWRVDPDRVGAIGVSAGGHLAAMLALRPNPHGREAVCAVNANGEGDLTVFGSEPIMANEVQILEAVLGDQPFDSADLADLSPTRWVQNGSNPVWVVHSTGDGNVYFTQGQRFYNELVSHGVDTGFTVIDDDCHGKCWKEGEALRDTRAFFARHLGLGDS